MVTVRRFLIIGFAILGCVGVASGKPRLPDPEYRDNVEGVLAEASTRDQITQHVDRPPERCVPSGVNTELCQWSLGNRDSGWELLAKAIDTSDRVALLCELPADGGVRAMDSCSAHPMRSNRNQFHIRTSRVGGKRARTGVDSEQMRAKNQKAADGWIENARTLVEMSRLMGAAPDRCVSIENDLRNCRWNASARVYGQGTLAAWIKAWSRNRIRLDCAFPIPGGPRARPCVAEVGK